MSETKTTETNVEITGAELSGMWAEQTDSELTIPVGTQLYIQPTDLTANEANKKARPGESIEQRQKRVESMAASILEIGQRQPVQVIATEEGTYEYVDGGGRVDAILYINSQLPPSKQDQIMTVWCTVVDASEDHFRTAVISNIQREGNTPWQMALIVQEVRERMGWKGRGTDTKISNYLGLPPSRITDYNKILNASEEVKALLQSGEIPSLDAALKLIAVPESAKPEVTKRAKAIAKEEAEAAEAAAKASGKESKTGGTSGGSYNPAPIKAKHIEKAARETEEVTGPIKRNRAEILEFFEEITTVVYSTEVVAFAEAFLKWASGELKSDKTLLKKFDIAIGLEAPSAKVVKAKK